MIDMSDVTDPVILREVYAEDLPIFFTQQIDVEACAVAAFPPRSQPDFDAHWERILADGSAISRTIVAGGAVAGYMSIFGEPYERSIAYWLGREFWGRGTATAALGQLLSEVSERPLFAHVAEHNAGSLRVLEKCGFNREGAEEAEDGITEIRLALRA